MKKNIKTFDNWNDFEAYVQGTPPAQVTNSIRFDDDGIMCELRDETVRLDCDPEARAEYFKRALRLFPVNQYQMAGVSKALQLLRGRVDELEKARTIHVTDIGILRQQVRDVRAQLKAMRLGLIAAGVAVAVIAIMQIL